MSDSVTEGHETALDERLGAYAPPPPSITPRQQQALQALLTGATDTEAADTANVTRETVNRWRHRDADFIASLAEARRDLSQDFRDGLRALLPDVLAALRDGLADANINTRLRVASTLLRSLDQVGEPAGPSNPKAIRVAWQREERELEFEALFNG